MLVEVWPKAKLIYSVFQSIFLEKDKNSFCRRVGGLMSRWGSNQQLLLFFVNLKVISGYPATDWQERERCLRKSDGRSAPFQDLRKAPFWGNTFYEKDFEENKLSKTRKQMRKGFEETNSRKAPFWGKQIVEKKHFEETNCQIPSITAIRPVCKSHRHHCHLSSHRFLVVDRPDIIRGEIYAGPGPPPSPAQISHNDLTNIIQISHKYYTNISYLWQFKIEASSQMLPLSWGIKFPWAGIWLLTNRIEGALRPEPFSAVCFKFNHTYY